MRYWLKSARVAKGLNQAELAKMVGISSQALSLIERGISMPRPKTARALQHILGIDPGDFYDSPDCTNL